MKDKSAFLGLFSLIIIILTVIQIPTCNRNSTYAYTIYYEDMGVPMMYSSICSEFGDSLKGVFDSYKDCFNDYKVVRDNIIRSKKLKRVDIYKYEHFKRFIIKDTNGF